jgi:hypothetical protein
MGELTDVASQFIDPGTLLPANSLLWKSSKVDVRKINGNTSSAFPSREVIEISPGPSRATAVPITMPSNPPRTLPFTTSKFIHPDTLTSYVPPEPSMSTKKAEEALKDFFESALTPEEEIETKDADGTVKGLHVTLMKHQIEGLQFLHDHESNDDKTKGKGKYGGILADDVLLLHFAKVNNRWVLEKLSKHLR